MANTYLVKSKFLSKVGKHQYALEAFLKSIEWLKKSDRLAAKKFKVDYIEMSALYEKAGKLTDARRSLRKAVEAELRQQYPR